MSPPPFTRNAGASAKPAQWSEMLDLLSILQEFGNLRALRVLILHSNFFTNDLSSQNIFMYTPANSKGNIPSEIGNLSNLIGLALGDNNLTGPIPTIVEGLREIQVFDLYRNRLTGSLASDIVLQGAWLSNSLGGTLPTRTGELKAWTSIDLSE
ncbi:unnamed protein product [Dovyalis caffra]|uniref:Uncharacterized protein n=1 Tax=Dovyalis caffra TaxID=77055 RepID=A0AAV1RT68_9ROSI|nr:unnamed protein product [Dovyalis caffra]